MSLKYPDILEHNNPNYALLDSNEIRGYAIKETIAERDLIPEDKRKNGAVVVVNTEQTIYYYTSNDITDVEWTNVANWKDITSVDLSNYIQIDGSNMGLENYQDFFNNDILDLNTALNLYVDDTIGDDNNDGLTELTSVQTIERVFELLSNKKITDNVNIYVGPGTYNINAESIFKYSKSINMIQNKYISFIGTRTLVYDNITINNVMGRGNIREFSNITVSDNELQGLFVQGGGLTCTAVAGNEGNLLYLASNIPSGTNKQFYSINTIFNFETVNFISKETNINMLFRYIEFTRPLQTDNIVLQQGNFMFQSCKFSRELGSGILGATFNYIRFNDCLFGTSTYQKRRLSVSMLMLLTRPTFINGYRIENACDCSIFGNTIVYNSTLCNLKNSNIYCNNIDQNTITMIGSNTLSNNNTDTALFSENENGRFQGKIELQGLVRFTNEGLDAFTYPATVSSFETIIKAFDPVLYPLNFVLPTNIDLYPPVDLALGRNVYIEGQTHNTKEFLDYHGKMVIDNNTRSLGVNQGLPTSTIDIDGSIAKTHRIITEDTLLGYNDHIIICNSINPIILTLPDATTCLNREYKIINENNGIVSINSITLNLSEIVTVYSDGTDWINIEFIGEQTGKANISGDNITFDTAPTIDISDEIIFDGTSGWYKRSIETIRNFINLQTETITGEKTFNDAYVPTNSILENTSIVNKEYVESLIDAGVIWQNPVDDIVDTLPSGYLNQRVIYNNSIHTYNGSTWVETVPQTGWTVWVVDDTVTPANDLGWYNFNGTTWVSVGTSLNHEYMTNLLGGINNEHYHITQSQHEILTGTNGIVNADSLHTHTSTSVSKNIIQYVDALVTVNDNDLASNTGLSNTPLNGSHIQVQINGVSVRLGNGVKTTICYFSGDGGVTAKTFDNIVSGDLLYWNGSGKYQLEVLDTISFNYKISL